LSGPRRYPAHPLHGEDDEPGVAPSALSSASPATASINSGGELAMNAVAWPVRP
jgi:hypothetical protein